MALLEVDDLAVRYKVSTPLFCKQRYLYAVNGISFSLDRGETLGLVGESGCGKSTLGKALVKLEQPYRGSIMLDGEDVIHAKGSKLREVRKKFQMIFQDPYSSLNPRLSIFSALDEVISLHTDAKRAARREQAVQLLEKVGLTADALDRYPTSFPAVSGSVSALPVHWQHHRNSSLPMSRFRHWMSACRHRLSI